MGARIELDLKNDRYSVIREEHEKSFSISEFLKRDDVRRIYNMEREEFNQLYDDAKKSTEFLLGLIGNTLTIPPMCASDFSRLVPNFAHGLKSYLCSLEVICALRKAQYAIKNCGIPEVREPEPPGDEAPYAR